MKKIIAFTVCLLSLYNANAQENVITTGVPFLLVAADARAAGMGDNGVATSSDAYSQQWNPAKYAFALTKQGFSLSYTPYLVELVNDISLGQVTYFNKLNERSAFGASFRYFSVGEIELRTDFDAPVYIVKPAEYAIDLSYSLKLSEMFSMAVAGRYINSSLAIPSEGQDNSAASSFAIDVAGFYQSEEIAFNDFNGKWRAGFNFQNMGPKINYDLNTSSDAGSNFLPANMKLGGGFDFILDDYNKVALNLEISKLMVPTPPAYVEPVDSNGNGKIDTDESLAANEENSQNIIDYNNIGWFEGMIQSFSDAPGGFSEELQEITYSVATEYKYQDAFAVRLGYFYENENKGARQFFSLGAGFAYNIMKLDVSYLFSTSNVINPLENTLRFSLSFAIGEKYEEY
ncbi:MAG TPA: type IX secretion system outer membrane channel protein PorV [Flavobacterium sp.]|jgi:hypothetical protein|nr:type IX secretion system outer membrane channel protein PorV [Flavobacterium sp.]